MTVRVQPATRTCWPDVERLFGPTGAYAGCWCMFLRTSSKVFEAQCQGGGAANREALKALVEGGAEPGLLAYRDDVPIGWVALAPREEYGRVLRSPLHKPIDDEPGVWAITCFFVTSEAALAAKWIIWLIRAYLEQNLGASQKQKLLRVRKILVLLPMT